MKKFVTVIIFLSATLLSGCSGKHGKVYPTVPATACGVGTVSATALSSGIRFIDAVNVSSAGGLSEHPSLANSGGGNLYVAWDDDEITGNKDIYFRQSHDYGSTYQPQVNVSNTGNATFASIAVGNDSNKTIHIAWQDVTAGPSEIRYARSTDGGVTFSAPVQVSAPNAKGDTSTQSKEAFMAIDSRPGGTGNIYLAWSEDGATFAFNIARSTDNGATFSIVNTYVPANSADTAAVSMAVDAAGNLNLSWAETVTTTSVVNGVPTNVNVRTIHYAKSTDGGVTLSGLLTLATGSTLATPSIAVDPSGNGGVYVAWRDEDDAHIHFTSSSDSGNSFNPETAIVAGPSGYQSLSPRLATGVDGTLYMSWTDNRGGNYDTYYTKSTDQGATFSAPVDFSPSAQGSLYTAITVDAESNIYIGWDDNRYPNPANVLPVLGDEGNFEVLVARGKQNLPAVQDALASPCPISPNGDSVADTTTITADFSGVLNWALDILSPPDANGKTQSVFHQTGSGTSMSVIWDGKNNGTVVPDGLYSYSVTGSDSNGLVATAATGNLDLYTTAANIAPAIVVTSSSSNGLATPVATGNTTITATSGSISGSTILTVTSATLVSIAVTPANSTIPLGAMRQLIATGTYSDGTTQDITAAVTWSSSSTAVASINSNGLAASVSSGNTTITAAMGSVSGSTTLAVAMSSATLVSIAVMPANPSIALGATRQFTATGTYSDSTTQDITAAVTWISSSPAVATVSNTSNSNGLAASVTTGNTTITATLGSISGSGTLAVTSATLVSIAVTPANPSIALGTTQQYTATGTFSDGTTQDITTSVTWSSSNSAVATDVIQTSSFTREAFGFSPNGDGFKDSDGISAVFNKPVNWAVQIEDATGAVKRTLSGSGIYIDSEVTRWDGKDDAGNLLPEGNYSLILTITDQFGQTASCGKRPVPCLNMEIDNTAPAVQGAAVDQAIYTPSATNPLIISGTPTELSLVTIYVYNKSGVLERKVDRSFREATDANGAPLTFNVTWDGKDGNGQYVFPGNYEVYVWCRDRAGNVAKVYPQKLPFTVQ